MRLSLAPHTLVNHHCCTLLGCPRVPFITQVLSASQGHLLAIAEVLIFPYIPLKSTLCNNFPRRKYTFFCFFLPFSTFFYLYIHFYLLKLVCFFCQFTK